MYVIEDALGMIPGLERPSGDRYGVLAPTATTSAPLPTPVQTITRAVSPTPTSTASSPISSRTTSPLPTSAISSSIPSMPKTSAPRVTGGGLLPEPINTREPRFSLPTPSLNRPTDMMRPLPAGARAPIDRIVSRPTRDRHGGMRGNSEYAKQRALLAAVDRAARAVQYVRSENISLEEAMQKAGFPQDQNPGDMVDRAKRHGKGRGLDMDRGPGGRGSRGLSGFGALGVLSSGLPEADQADVDAAVIQYFIDQGVWNSQTVSQAIITATKVAAGGMLRPSAGKQLLTLGPATKPLSTSKAKSVTALGPSSKSTGKSASAASTASSSTASAAASEGGFPLLYAGGGLLAAFVAWKMLSKRKVS